MNRPRFYYASDYAGLEFRGGDFYYGYEHTICSECGKTTLPGHEFCDQCKDADRDWCFVAKFSGNEIVIPFSKLGCKDMFNVVDCLMTGVGWVLAKYELVPSEKSDLEDEVSPPPIENLPKIAKSQWRQGCYPI